MPIPPDPSVLVTELREHLIAQGLVRRSTAAAPAELPKLYSEPESLPTPAAAGAPATIGVWRDGGSSARPYESSLTVDKVEFVLRTLEPYAADLIYAGLRAELTDRRNWQMGNWTIAASDEWRKLQRVGANSDAVTHDFAVLFTTYA